MQPKVKKSTIRYAAKQAYQLWMMTAKSSSTVCKLWCHVVVDETQCGGTVVLVYSHKGTVENPSELLASIKPAKAWRELI